MPLSTLTNVRYRRTLDRAAQDFDHGFMFDVQEQRERPNPHRPRSYWLAFLNQGPWRLHEFGPRMAVLKRIVCQALRASMPAGGTLPLFYAVARC